jgi:hypothetical protein
MSLKSLVNDKNTWDSFLEEINDMIRIEHVRLENASDTVEISRAQGAVSTLKRLKFLRDKVNGSK